MFMFILGVLVMSFVATIGFTLYDSGQEVGAFFNGPILWLVMILSSIIRLIENIYNYVFFCSYLVKEDGTRWYCNHRKWYYDIIWNSPDFLTGKGSNPRVSRKWCKGLPKINKKEYERIKLGYDTDKD